MRTPFKIGARRALIACAVASSVLVGGVAQADAIMHVPGPDGIIHSCFDSSNGKLRVLDPALDQCKRSETQLQWSQTGPQGPAGVQGPIGPAGPAGPIGAAGTNGVSGYQRVTESINNFTVAPSTESVHVESCPAGEKVVGGGFVSFNAGGFLSTNTNGPVSDSQWAISVYNPSGNPVTIGTEDFYAVCVSAT
jgi:hypothetical protein